MSKLDGLLNEMKTMHDLEDITNMLEQVAARDIALMREQILQSRPFFQEFWKIYRVVKELTPVAPEVVHKHLVAVIGIDWGMPGNLLNRVVENAEELFMAEDVDMLLAGKMLHGRFAGRDDRTIHFFNAPKKASLQDITPIAKVIAGYARVTFIFPQFETLSEQTVQRANVTAQGEVTNAEEQKAAIEAKRFLVEPDPQTLANYLNEVVVGLSLYHHFAEATLAYSAAQMVAMRNSYENAKDESKRVKNQYNRARRAVIDTKLRELYGARIKGGM